MSDISKWKDLAAGNVLSPPDGWPEAMARSAVNDTGREMMAALRRMWDDPDWKNPFDTDSPPTLARLSDVKISVNIPLAEAQTYFPIGVKVRIRGNLQEPAYAFVKAVTFVGADSEIEFESFDDTGDPTPSSAVPTNFNGIDAYFVGGGINSNHGIGSSAFETGLSGFFEEPSASTSVAVNAAIEASKESGKPVRLPNGEIDVTVPITVSASVGEEFPVRIFGRSSGDSVFKLADETNVNVIEIGEDVTGLNLSDFQIDGNQANQTTAGAGIVFADNPTNIHIDSVFVKNCWGRGISFEGESIAPEDNVENVWITNTRVDTTGDSGIQIEDPTGLNHNIQISNCFVRAFGDSGDASTSGVEAAGVDIGGKSQISNLVIEPVQSATVSGSFAGYGLRSRPPGSGSAVPPGGHRSQWSNIRVEGNQSGTLKGIGLGGFGVQLSNVLVSLTGSGVIIPLSIQGFGSGAGHSSDHVISNMLVTDGKRSEIFGTASGVTITGSQFLESAVGDYALKVEGEDVKIIGCSFDGGGSLTLAGGGIQSLANRVDIKDCSFRGIQHTAVDLGSTANDNSVMGCSFNNCTTIVGDAAVGVEGDDHTISNNTFKNIDIDAISITAVCNQLQVNNNSFTDITGVAIKSSETNADSAFMGNVFTATGTDIETVTLGPGYNEPLVGSLTTLSLTGGQKIICLTENITCNEGIVGNANEFVVTPGATGNVWYYLDEFMGIEFPSGGADGNRYYALQYNIEVGVDDAWANSALYFYIGPNGTIQDFSHAHATDFLPAGQGERIDSVNLSADGTKVAGQLSHRLTAELPRPGMTYDTPGFGYLSQYIIRPESGWKLSVAVNNTNNQLHPVYKGPQNTPYQGIGEQRFANNPANGIIGGMILTVPPVRTIADSTQGEDGCWIAIWEVPAPNVTEVSANPP